MNPDQPTRKITIYENGDAGPELTAAVDADGQLEVEVYDPHVPGAESDGTTASITLSRGKAIELRDWLVARLAT